MSQRHRDADLPVPAKQELRAHAHGGGIASMSSCPTCVAGQRRSRPGRRARARGSVEARAPPRPRRGSEQAAQPLCADGDTEAEDVEAALEDAPGEDKALASPSNEQQSLARHVGSATSQRRRSRLARSCHSSGGDGVAHVVLPNAVDLQHAHGDAFRADVELLHHPPAVGVARHDVDLQAMQPQSLEGELEDDDDTFGDEATPGVALVDPVADRAGLRAPRRTWLTLTSPQIRSSTNNPKPNDRPAAASRSRAVQRDTKASRLTAGSNWATGRRGSHGVSQASLRWRTSRRAKSWATRGRSITRLP